MATVTGLTAERMMEIEAASVVDGQVSGDNLILIKHDGSQIDAGNVRGPAGAVGPMGKSLVVVTAQQLLDVGQLNQIRAGRQLTPSDFTNQGLSVPLGLWNLSNFNDSSGNGRHLTNKGSVPVGVGINGVASSAAVFAGSSGQGLYIPDTGVNDPFRIKTGSLGCWFRTAKRGVLQDVIAKASSAVNNYYLRVITGNTVSAQPFDGASTGYTPAGGIVDVCDDRWHFAVMTMDGTRTRLYVDGVYEGIANVNPLAATGGSLSIGGAYTDSAVATTNPFYGRIDEAFITADVLSDEQQRNLYCASIPHALGAVPVGSYLSVRRKKRGAPLDVTDFPSQPLRLHNFTGGTFTDQGSNNIPVAPVSGGTIVAVAGADGAMNGSFAFSGAHTGLASTDAGLPAGLASRSYGCWYKGGGASQCIMGWGNTSGANSDAIWFLNPSAAITSRSSGAAADDLSGPFGADLSWHHVVVVCDNLAGDGLKRKLYWDGEEVASSTILNSITLTGANHFRIGAFSDGGFPFNGQLDGIFVHAGALTPDQVRKIYDAGSQATAPSPKATDDHIESFENARLLAIFDSLETSDLIDLAVVS